MTGDRLGTYTIFNQQKNASSQVLGNTLVPVGERTLLCNLCNLLGNMTRSRRAGTSAVNLSVAYQSAVIWPGHATKIPLDRASLFQQITVFSHCYCLNSRSGCWRGRQCAAQPQPLVASALLRCALQALTALCQSTNLRSPEQALL